MTMRSDLIAWLRAQETVTALVDAGSIVDRVPPVTASYPLVVVNRAGVRRERNLAGHTGPVETVMQFGIWADAADTAEAISDTIRHALFALPQRTRIGSHLVHSARLEAESDSFDEETRQSGAILLIAIRHQEAP